MHIEYLREYCLAKTGATEGFPFGEDTLVFKVGEKIFLLAGLDNHPVSFNVKCDPDMAAELRERHPQSVFPGYHMNKKHWNTVICNGGLSNKQLEEFIDMSYQLVFTALSEKIRRSLTEG